MQKFIDTSITRRGVIAGLASAVAITSGPRVWSTTPQKPESPSTERIGFTYITKLPGVTLAQLMEFYENHHVPQALMSPMKYFPRYSRNYVIHVLGKDPSIDCIMEAAPTPDFPMNIACGRQMDWTWSGAVSGLVTEHVLHGPAWAFEAGPISKRAYLIEGTSMPEEELLAATIKLVDPLKSSSRRIILYIQHSVQKTFACVDAAAPAQALIMVWSKERTTLPDQLQHGAIPLRIPTVLDLVAFSSEVPVKG